MKILALINQNGFICHLLCQCVLEEIFNLLQSFPFSNKLNVFKINQLAVDVFDLFGDLKQDLIEKISALVPPPRRNIVRYFGVLAPHAKDR